MEGQKACPLPRTFLTFGQNSIQKKNERRNDLDWLRVLVFALLILYHVGMFFVPWGWHLKSNVIYEWLKWPMIFVNQWRLPILFLISGMGTFYALGKRSWGKFSRERLLRLGVPLIVGMLLIVPPQVYYERLGQGSFSGSYLEFQNIAFDGIYPEGNLSWHHLWFLPYLLLFSLLLSPLMVRIAQRPGRFMEGIGRLLQKPGNLYLLVAPLYLIEVFVEPFFPVTHALIGDWFTLVFNGYLFFLGFVLIGAGPLFWAGLEKIRKTALVIGLLAFSALLVLWLGFADSVLVHFIEGALKVVNLWSWILVLLAYASKLLTRPSNTLAYANRAFYPFYILHQTITVALAYYLMDLDWGLLPKALILILGTFGLSWAIYDLIILRISWLHPLFGLKPKKKLAT